MNKPRPAVYVEKVITEASDITHCTVAEVMTVTNASREQMEREARRVEAVPRGMPAGTLAVTGTMP